MLTLDFSSYPTLHTPNLVLRPMTDEDAPALFELRSDPAISRYIDRLPSSTMEDVLGFIQKIKKGIEGNLWLYWAVTVKGSDRLIGTICLWNFVPYDDKAELGYELSTAYQGRGFMIEAIRAVVTYGFETIGLMSLEAGVHPENAPSIRTLKRSGFTPVGQYLDTFMSGATVEMQIYEKRPEKKET
jgi:ribosomal-protein-alanine N-acetyltransferase